MYIVGARLLSRDDRGSNSPGDLTFAAIASGGLTDMLLAPLLRGVTG